MRIGYAQNTSRRRVTGEMRGIDHGEARGVERAVRLGRTDSTCMGQAFFFAFRVRSVTG